MTTATTPLHQRPLNNALVVLLAAATCIVVANLYYLQPLLHQVTREFHVGSARASLLITLIQVGYAAGLAFVVPLGDLFKRRGLLVVVFLIAAALMATGALLTSFAAFAVVTFVIGLASVGGQIIVPFAADLAEPAQRGRVIARVMTGLLMGIMLSRTVAGLIAQAAGWRAVYWLAASLLMLTAIALRLVLPDEPRRLHVGYWSLVGGSFTLFKDLSQLRRRSWLGALNFAGFSAMWTTLSFHLARSPFHYSNAVIGLFGLFGVAGVLAANFAGHHADRQRSHVATVLSASLFIVSFGILWFGRTSFWSLAIGIIALDTAIQGMQITNQSIIYSLTPDGRSRINSVYMVSCFLGASLGSYAAGQLYSALGWGSLCWLGAGIGVSMLIPALIWQNSPASQ